MASSEPRSDTSENADYPRSMVDRLRSASSSIAANAARRMESELRWVSQLSAEHRSWLGLLAQESVSRFVEWLDDPESAATSATEIFRAAPQALSRSVSLQNTVALIRLLVGVVEEEGAKLVESSDRRALRDAILVYSREVAFSAADVYAHAAENRGAWDARLETFAIDAIVRNAPDETLRSRVSTLGWSGQGRCVVLVGLAPPGLADEFTTEIRTHARALTNDVLVGLQGDKVIVVIAHPDDCDAAAVKLAGSFPSGPVVIGPSVADIAEASRSCRAALAGMLAAPAWGKAPVPVHADDLLPERMLNGDPLARRSLIDDLYKPLFEAGPTLIETLEEYIEQGHSLEGAARELFVHPNTVRYRLRRIAQVVGWDPADPREGYVLRTALAVGRLAEAVGGSTRAKATPSNL